MKLGNLSKEVIPFEIYSDFETRNILAFLSYITNIKIFHEELFYNSFKQKNKIYFN